MNTSYISGWYAILPSQFLKSKPIALERLGLNLVLWRQKNGMPIAMTDRCPHRGAKLSIGKIKNNCIECPYHGFQFNQKGNCDFAPEFDKPIPKLTVKCYAVQESMGMLWLNYGNESQDSIPEELLALDKNFNSRYAQTARVWQSNITYCIENQLDYTHLPDVHHNTIGRGFKIPEDPKFELGNDKISIYLKKNTSTIDFYFPNTWVLNVAAKMKLVVFFAPINERKTKLYLRTYNPVLKLPILRLLLAPLFNALNLIILKQDQRVVSSQGAGQSTQAKDDLLMKHDKAISYFRERWRQELKNHH